MNPNEYTCAYCGLEYESGLTEQQREAEFRSIWGDAYVNALPKDEYLIVCDDCFQKAHPHKHPHLMEEETARVLRGEK